MKNSVLRFVGCVAWVCAGFPSLTAWSATPTHIVTGFYRVISNAPEKSPFGKVFFLSSDEARINFRLDPQSPGLRGRFGFGGRIWTDLDPLTGMHTVRWRGRKDQNSKTESGSVRVDPNFHIFSLEGNSSNVPAVPGLFRERLLFTSGKNQAEETSLEVEHIARDEQGLREWAATEGLAKFQIRPTVYVSHRGSSFTETTNERGIYPANTIPAFDHAINQGYSGIELDVHVSKDGHMIVSHDQDLAVSGNCQGKIAEKTLEELADCEVSRSGFVPESGMAADVSFFSAPLPTLRQALQRYLPDPNVKVVVVDVKPGDLSQQAIALNRATEGFSADQLKKVLPLMRERALAKNMTEGSYGKVALEGPTGWEPIQDEQREEFLESEETGAISVSLGLGLGLAGNTWSAVGSALRSLPEMIWYRDLDLGYIRWNRKNVREFKELREQARKARKSLVAWTVNGSRNLRFTRNHFPGLEYVLSDSPFEVIAGLQLEDLLSDIERAKSKPASSRYFRSQYRPE